MLLYYKIFQAMHAKVRNGPKAMLAKTGVVLKNIDPEGKIKYANKIWNAVSDGKNFWWVKKWLSTAFLMA
jgi:membrane-bound ClpP family serine protease